MKFENFLGLKFNFMKLRGQILNYQFYLKWQMASCHMTQLWKNPHSFLSWTWFPLFPTALSGQASMLLSPPPSSLPVLASLFLSPRIVISFSFFELTAHLQSMVATARRATLTNWEAPGDAELGGNGFPAANRHRWQR